MTTEEYMLEWAIADARVLLSQITIIHSDLRAAKKQLLGFISDPSKFRRNNEYFIASLNSSGMMQNSASLEARMGALLGMLKAIDIAYPKPKDTEP